MLDVLDIVTSVLVIALPIAVVVAYLLRAKEVKSTQQTLFYEKVGYILGWLTVVTLFATAVVELLKGHYFMMTAHFLLFGFWTYLMNRETVTREQAR